MKVPTQATTPAKAIPSSSALALLPQAADVGGLNTHQACAGKPPEAVLVPPGEGGVGGTRARSL